jgi:glutamate-1-semialdehyde 2,1-aminomutase
MTAKLGRETSSTPIEHAILPPGALPPAARLERYKQSISAGQKIKELIPGGVDSPFRAFHEVGGEAIFFDSASGSKLTDLDGNEYIDYLGAWGPAILGHAPVETTKALSAIISRGAVFGAPHILELELAAQIAKIVPSIESLRFVNSGTEAVMSAVRLARGFTGRDMILMFGGGYHGHSDSVLASTGHSSSSGLLAAARDNTLLAKYNSLSSVEALFGEHKGQIAAILVEPVCGSMGLVKAEPGFLAGLREIASQNQALLIFDEVITGFRVAYGGAQALYNIKPDLTCYGKALGGGMPIGAYGGPRQIMSKLMPEGDVYQAGTFSGNPVTMTGGIQTLKALADPQLYSIMEERAAALFSGLKAVIDKHSYPVQLAREGSMFGVVFSKTPVKNFEHSKSIDATAYAKFFHHLLDNGVYMPPSAFDAALISVAHSPDDIASTVDKMQNAFKFAFA